MIGRQKRLIEVYEYLRQHRGIHTKTDFAESIRYGRTSMSAAINGNESYLTDSLFKNICEAFPQTFNLQYLLTGEGRLLTIEEEVSKAEYEHIGCALEFYDRYHGKRQEQEANIIGLYSHLISDLELMRRQTQQELTLLQEARHDYIQAIRELKNITEKITLQYPTTLAAEDSQEIYNKQ